MKILPFIFLTFAVVSGCSDTPGHHDITARQNLGVKEPDTMDPNDILFTTPTLNDSIPTTVSSSSVDTHCIQTHEDNWRQFEFIDVGFKREIDAELADISKIWDTKSVPLGDAGTAFREVHVRKRIPTPLHVRMPLDEFETLVGTRAVPMAFFTYDEVLADVHAFQIDNLVVYGLIQDGHLTAFGLEPLDQFAIPNDLIDRLKRFIQDHNLVLIHWRSRTSFQTNEEILKYLGARG